jgi:hypothetical protein
MKYCLVIRESTGCKFYVTATQFLRHQRLMQWMTQTDRHTLALKHKHAYIKFRSKSLMSWHRVMYSLRSLKSKTAGVVCSLAANVNTTNLIHRCSSQHKLLRQMFGSQKVQGMRFSYLYQLDIVFITSYILIGLNVQILSLLSYLFVFSLSIFVCFPCWTSSSFLSSLPNFFTKTYIGCSERRLIGHLFYRRNFLRKCCSTCREKFRRAAPCTEKSDKPAAAFFLASGVALS